MFQRKKLSIAIWQAAGLCFVAGLTSSAVAQTASIEKTTVTGSNIKRVDAETSQPVQVITRADIDRTGAGTVEELLQTISSANSNANTVASAASGATTGGISTASLRGLGSQRTLVLINGRRATAYGTITDSVSVDVNSIPLAAIQRIEILRDGASAIYGSDAIAGVVNFILRSDYQGGEATVEYGRAVPRGGAVEKRISGVAGFGDVAKDRFNVMLVGNYAESAALFGRDRDFANTGVNVGALNDTTSGNTFPGNITFNGLTRNPLQGNCAPSITDPLFSASRCRFDPAPYVSLLPEAKRGGVFGTARFAITNQIEAFIDASYNKSQQQFVIQPVPISDQFALPPSHPLFNVAPYNGFSRIILTPSSAFYPTAYVRSIIGDTAALPNLNVRYRSFGTGPRDLTDTAQVPRVTFGIKGALAGWDFDASYLFTESKLTEHVNGGYPSLSKILPLLNSGQVNLFGANSAAVQAQLDATQFREDAYQTKSGIQSFNAKASRELFNLPAGPLAVALGTELRKEKFVISPNQTIQTGDISGYGGNFLPVDRTRNVTAFFAEANIPIVKTLESNVAVRYDDYQGVGSKTTPKVGLRWQPSKQLLVRGSYGKGFRAPSLLDLYAPNLTGVTASGLSDPLRCKVTTSSNDCQTQFPQITGGNSRLKPETSDNYTFGFVIEPVDNLSFSADAFKIRLKETIIYGLTPATILGDLGQFGGLVTRGPSAAPFASLPGPIISIDQTNLNLGETRVGGVDVDLKATFPAGEAGRFTARMNGTYFWQYDTQNLDGTFSNAIGNLSSTTGSGGLVPRWRHYLSLEWAKGPWSTMIAQLYQGSHNDLPGTFEDNSDPGYKPRRVGAYEVFDWQGSYTGIKNMRFTLGVRNIFDRAPPYTNAGGQNYFQSGYDVSYASPVGRFIYGRVNFAFK